MRVNAIALAWRRGRPAGLAPGVLPAPALLALSAVAAGLWGLLLHAAAASSAAPLAFFAVGLAAALASIGGFAFSPICGALLLPLTGNPVRAVQVILVCSIANQAMSLWLLRRDIAWRALLPYLAGGALGLPAGLALLLHTDPGTYPRLLGGLLVAYTLWMVLGRPVRLPPMGWLAKGAVGVLGGVTDGLAGFPSAPLTIWCGLQGWDKARQRGLYQPFILPMQVLALVLMPVMAPARGDAAPWMEALLFVPASLLGTACGLALFRRMTDRQFGRAVALMLLAAGLSMMAR